MPLKPPISLDELKAIGERRKGDKDVAALLREIKRYHVLMSRFYQLARSVPPGGPMGIIAQAALNEIADDPAVRDIIRADAGLLGGPVVHGNDGD
ncbi:MAG TPA: hypothetical protein VEC01_01500 [Noviherbaspirillum sp.]|uniref:hypothetical protein n=1 Tax=Noviherbaspirillum sp. TaxID=1926288 RepID=UPI002D6B216E|nr:hypothetical protein [Noviherbaspirillum sp.]HYD93971.1 hypothetical protein [Noviherbaspirillum sp.]